MPSAQLTCGPALEDHEASIAEIGTAVGLHRQCDARCCNGLRNYADHSKCARAPDNHSRGAGMRCAVEFVQGAEKIQQH
jgi:hypothetical protein